MKTFKRGDGKHYSLLGQSRRFKKAWLEIEDIMAAKHAHKRQITQFKYGGCIRLSMGKF